MKKAAIIILILGIGIQFIPVPKNQTEKVSEADFYKPWRHLFRFRI